MNPAKFKGDATNIYNGITAEQIWERDKKKKELAEQNGYKVMTVWESDFDNSITQVIQKCKEFILQK